MAIYYFSLIILSILALVESNLKKIHFNFISFSLYLLLIILVGFRSETFGDYCSYVISFFDTPNIIGFFHIYQDYSFHFEYGYDAIMIISKSIISHHIFHFFVVGGLSLAITFFCIRKMSPYFFLSILIFFSHVYLLKDLAQIRSGLAASIILLSFYFLANAKVIKYFSFVLLASSIHLTALTTIIGYFFIRIMNIFSYQRMIYIIILSFVFLVTSLSFHFYLIDFFISQDLLPDRFYIYYGDCPEEFIGDCAMINNVNSQSLGILTNFATVKYLLVVLFCLLFFQKLIDNSKYFKTIFNFYFVGLCWIIFFNETGIFGSRISSVFAAGEIILIPMIVNIIKPELISKLLVILLSTCIAYVNINKHFEISNNSDLPYNAFYSGDFCPPIQNNWLHNKDLIMRVN